MILIPRKNITHKFHAKACERDGRKFPSKAERAYYDKLCLLKKTGQVLFFLRQIPFELPGNITYRADFMVFYIDGEIEIIDVKGYLTPMSKTKIAMVEDIYPVKITLTK